MIASAVLCVASHFLPSPVCMTAFTVLLCLTGVCLHEFAHAATAFLGGSEHVAEAGYLTCDLLRYMNPFDIFISAISIVLGGFVLPGARVYVDRTDVQSRGWETAISLAGPLANLLLALVASFAVRVYVLANLTSLPTILPLPIVGLIWWVSPRKEFRVQQLTTFVFLEVVSCFLNLLPLPPLDGWNALDPYIPRTCWLKAFLARDTLRMRLCHLAVIVLFYVTFAHVPATWSMLAYSAAAMSGLPAQVFLPCMDLMMHPRSIASAIGVDTRLLLKL
ncbi:hypothetical protein Esti_002256 [Eimeria stiedai]